MTDNKEVTYAHYIPENDYHSRGFAPFKAATQDMCGRCETYYANLYKTGKTKNPFPPNCQKHILNRQQGVHQNDFATLEDYAAAQILLDPVLWAKSEFDWEPRWYQEQMLSCTSQKKLYRCGRRMGKTEGMVIECLYEMFTKKDINVLMIAPYERQVTRFFDEIARFVKNSASLKSSVHRYIKSPSRMELVNGSKILGFSSAATGSSRSDKIRGQDAHLIIIDEMDYLLDEDIEAIIAILASRPECRIIAASTPQGWRKKFFNYCTNKDLGFKEFWFISAESPVWTKELDDFFASGAGGKDSAGYKHEYLADFAEQEEGVFKAEHINRSIEKYDLDQQGPIPGYQYIMGVDWNKSAGTHMVIFQWGDNGKLKLVKKIIIPESEYTQTAAVTKIIQLNMAWGLKYIFVDAGYGATQVELLKKEGMRNRGTGLDKKVIPIAMNQHVELKDPTNGADLIKTAKPFLVQQTAKILEDGRLILPMSEDTAISDQKAILGLIQQMRNFKVESYSIYGLPRYSQGQDHTLTAMILACGGFVLKEGELSRVAYATRVGAVAVTNNPLASDKAVITPAMQEVLDAEASGLTLTRTNKPGGYRANKPVYIRDMDAGRSVFRKSTVRGSESNRRRIERDNNPRRDGGSGGFSRKNV